MLKNIGTVNQNHSFSRNKRYKAKSVARSVMLKTRVKNFKKYITSFLTSNSSKYSRGSQQNMSTLLLQHVLFFREDEEEFFRTGYFADELLWESIVLCVGSPCGYGDAPIDEESA